MIQQTTSLRKIATLRKPISIVRGGQGSGKTISILIILINHASGVPNREILVLSEELTKMRLTVIKDFVKIMREIGIFEPSSFLAETLYKFPNGSFIKFIGLDKEDVGKGLRSHVAYFNEVNKCNRESYIQVASRADKVYADYNPDAEFYIDTDVIPRPDADFLQLTFKDNELLPERERENILNYYNQGYNEDGSIKDAYWANKWQVYGLGNIGNLQGVVFSNWQICDEIPEHANTLCYAMDFGFTNDPTALIQVFKHDGMLWLDELVYERGLTNPDIVSKLVEYGVTGPIVADSAEPKSIEEIRRMWSGDIEPAEKGPDSIRNSIDTLHRYKLMVTKTSLNLINELRSYRWREDKSGNSLNEPIDKNNHAIDAVRYAALNYIGNPSIFEVY